MFLFLCALLTHSIQTNCGPVFKDLTPCSKNFKPHSTKSRIILYPNRYQNIQFTFNQTSNETFRICESDYVYIELYPHNIITGVTNSLCIPIRPNVNVLHIQTFKWEPKT